MRRSIAFGLALGVVASLTQNATAQLLGRRGRRGRRWRMADSDRAHGSRRLRGQRGTRTRQSADGGFIQETKPGARGRHQSWRIAAVTAPDFVEMQGGLPIVVDGEVIGAIG